MDATELQHPFITHLKWTKIYHIQNKLLLLHEGLQSRRKKVIYLDPRVGCCWQQGEISLRIFGEGNQSGCLYKISDQKTSYELNQKGIH